MRWKDSNDADGLGAPGAEVRYEDPVLSTGRGSSSRRRSLLLPAAVSAAVLLLALFVYALIPGGGSPDDTVRLESIENRLNVMQRRMDELFARTETGPGPQESLAPLVGRLDRLEASLNLRMDQIEKEIGALQKKSARQAPVLPARKPPPAAAPASGSAPSGGAVSPIGRSHTVRSGETMYGISRQYGLTVDALRRLNRLKADDVIRPGQKLTVRPE